MSLVRSDPNFPLIIMVICPCEAPIWQDSPWVSSLAFGLSLFTRYLIKPMNAVINQIECFAKSHYLPMTVNALFKLHLCALQVRERSFDTIQKLHHHQLSSVGSRGRSARWAPQEDPSVLMRIGLNTTCWSPVITVRRLVKTEDWVDSV